MNNEIVKVSAAIMTADDSKVIALFVNTKRSSNTKVQYVHSISLLLATVGKGMREVTMEDAVAYHHQLQGKYDSLHSIKLHINVAKALFGFALAINYLRTNVFAVIKPDATPEVTHKRILTEEQVLALIAAPKKNRDKLMLRLLYAAGLRASELCALTWEALQSNGVLWISNGKGQKERFITLSDSMVAKLTAFRDSAQSNAPMFVSQKGGKLDESQLHRIVKAAAVSAGLSGDASAHWLRHSHASHSLDRGATLVSVRDTLGHASIATTNKYLHSKRQDSSALHLAV
jgi:integrase/recombinase XerD